MNNQELFQLLKSVNATRELIMKEIRKIEWQHLAANDLKFEAILSYNKKYNCGLVEAKTEVEKFMENITERN